MTLDAQHLLDVAAQGTVSDQSLADGQFQNLDLSGVHFKNVDASRADFSGCTLTNTWWEQCTLDAAVFTDADFGRATLQDCVMTAVRLPASFGPVLLLQCQLSNLNASDADWTQVQVRDSVLYQAKFQFTRFEQCAFEHCQMEGADFTKTQGGFLSFWHSVLPRSRFIDAQLQGAIFTHAQVSEADFTGAALEQSHWVRAVAHAVVFTGANLSMADASHLDGAGSNFSDARVHLLNLHAARLDGVSWHNCDRSTIRDTDPVLLEAETWQPDSRWAQPA